MICTKQGYTTRAGASKAMNLSLARRKRQPNDHLCEVYKCPECSTLANPVWHWGHKVYRKEKPKSDGK